MDFNVKVLQKTLTFEAGEISKTCSVDYRGFLSALVCDIPNFTNSVAVSYSIKNILGHEIAGYENMIDDNDTVHHFPFAYCPLAHDFTLTVTLSGVPGGVGGDVTIIMYVY